MKKVFSSIMIFLMILSTFSTFIPQVKAQATSSSNTSDPSPADTDWPMFQHDLRHTGYSSSVAPTTNNTLWVYSTGGPIDMSSPVAVNDIVYMHSSDGKLYALNVTTGRLVWSFTAGTVYRTPAVSDGIIYVGCGEPVGGKLYALNATTGAFIWSYDTGETRIGTEISVANGMAFFGTGMYSGKIFALNASTGKLIWKYSTSSSHVSSSPAVVNDVVYVGVYWENMVYAMNASTGEVIWRYETGGVVGPSPSVVEGIVYIGSHDHKIHAINATTGAPIWTYTTGHEIVASAAVAHGVVYVGSRDGKFYALNATTGALKWFQTIGVTSSSAVADGKIYVGSSDHRVYCLNETTGTIIWTYTTGNAVSSLAIADGKVFVGSNDGNVYCFGSIPPKFDIRLVFSTSEQYYPVNGLFFDNDQDITNNYLNYKSMNYPLPSDLNGDGKLDIPTYFYLTEENEYLVYQFWIYYAYNNKLMSEHEHDFEYIFVWVNKTNGQISRVALNQHRWTNNYEFTTSPTTIYIAAEEGGHGMIMLEGDTDGDGLPDDRNNDGWFDVKKPDNCRLAWPGQHTALALGKYNRFSIIASLYPWKYYDGKNTVEGFGDSALLRKGGDYGLIDLFAYLELLNPVFYLDTINAALITPLLLKSNKPWTVSFRGIEITLPFFIEAPWVRAVFFQPELQWKKTSFEWWLIKPNVKAAIDVVTSNLNVIYRTILRGSAKAIVSALFDPINATIRDSEGRFLGYKDGRMVDEIPEGFLLWTSESYDVFSIVNVTDGYSYTIRSEASGNYNMTLIITYSDNSTQAFEAVLIPVQKGSVHSYTVNWESLKQGESGVKVLIDQDGNGIFERTIDTKSKLTGSEFNPSLWEQYGSLFLASIVFAAVAIAILVFYKRVRRSHISIQSKTGKKE